MKIDSLDYLMLIAKNIETTCEFCTRVLGMAIINFGENRESICMKLAKNLNPILVLFDN